ncbi:MAG: amidohydrolase family protein [Bacilli bacterium]
MKKYVYATKGIYGRPSDNFITIENSQICAIETSSLPKTEGEDTLIVDGYIMPVFYDHHLHFIGLGERFSSLSVEHATTVEDAIATINAADLSLEVPLFVLTNENITNMLTNHHLNGIKAKRAIVAFSSCRHALCMNNVALQRVEHLFTSADILPIHRRNGEWTGWLTDAIAETVRAHFLAYETSEMLSYMKIARQKCYEYGIVGVVTEDLHYYNNANRVIDAYEQLTAEHEPPFYLHYLVHHCELVNVRERLEQTTPWLTNSAVKIFVDGTFSQRTARVSHLYSEGSGNGNLVHAPHELEKIVEVARAAERNVAFHCIGDGALDEVISILHQFPNRLNTPDRIIHATMVRKDQWEHLQHLSVQLDVQPIFMQDEQQEMNLFAEDVSAWFNRWDIAQEKKIRVVGSSDAPIADNNPWVGIQYAIQRVSLENAIAMYTRNSYCFPNTSHLKVGNHATFQVVSEIPTAYKEQLSKIVTKLTIVEGKVVYEN